MAYDDEDKKEEGEVSSDLLEGAADETDEDEDEDEDLPAAVDGDGEGKWE